MITITEQKTNQEVLSLFLAGKSILDIADDYGVGDYTIEYILRRAITLSGKINVA